MLALKSSKHPVNCFRVANTSVFPLCSPTASYPEDTPGMQLPYVTEILPWQTTGQQRSTYTLTGQGLCCGTSGWGATWLLCNSKFSQAFQSESGSGVRYPVHPDHAPSLAGDRTLQHLLLAQFPGAYFQSLYRRTSLCQSVSSIALSFWISYCTLHRLAAGRLSRR